ncbi:MAG: hypothetical protein D3918_07885 [Candidatus Electrothrix sp. AX2]|nr:hypothetical protein [Candidatus Electrothrix gigas]
MAFCEEELAFVYKEIQSRLDPNASLADKMLLLLMSQFRFITRNKAFGRTLLREMTFPKEMTIDKSRKVEEKFLELFVTLLQEAQQNGELSQHLELTITGGHFYSLYLMALSAWYSGRLLTEEDVQETLELMIEQTLTGLIPREITLSVSSNPS